MRLLLCGVFIVGLLSSSCMASGNKGKRVNDNMLPILGAVGKEVLFEAQSDVPKITQEMGSQVTHLSTLRKTCQHRPNFIQQADGD